MGRALLLPSPLPSPALPRITAHPQRRSLFFTKPKNAGSRRTQSSRQESGTTEEPASRNLPIDQLPQAQPVDGTGGEKSSQEQAQDEQRQIAEALKELRKSPPSPDSAGFWEGLGQEIGMIEWPNPSKVFGTTLVVLGIIMGSSLVLLTVNFLLAELSDIVFKVQ